CQRFPGARWRNEHLGPLEQLQRDYQAVGLRIRHRGLRGCVCRESGATTARSAGTAYGFDCKSVAGSQIAPAWRAADGAAARLACRTCAVDASSKPKTSQKTGPTFAVKRWPLARLHTINAMTPMKSPNTASEGLSGSLRCLR